MHHLNLSLNDDWNLSDEVQTFDKNTLLDSIILKGGTFEPIYTDPYFLAQMSSAWWRKWSPTFEKWFIAAEKEYEPLWDRNGWEEIDDTTIDDGKTSQTTDNTEVMDDDTTKHAVTKEVTDDDKTHDSQTNSTTTTASTGSANTVNSVSAYDAGDTLVTHDASNTNTKDDTTVTGSTTLKESSTDDKTVDTTYDETGTDDRTTKFDGQQDGTSYNKNTFDHSLHSWGNWGISQTSQKLLQAEFNVRYNTNPYELMTEIFCREMCVRVF